MEDRGRVDLDKVVSYKDEYMSAIENARITGDNLTGLCPFHDDRNTSFSVNLKTGMWHCFAEDDGGNFVSFWAKLHDTDTKTAYRQILEKYHIDAPAQKKRKRKPGERLESYTLAQYASEKHLPEEFLEKVCHVSTVRDTYRGATYLKIPYYDADGSEATYRKRYGNKEFRWAHESGGQICLYGLWRLDDIRNAGYVILVEGESDTQSLWLMGFPALGVPGATMFKSEYTAALRDLRLFIHREPDHGGETFVHKVCDNLRRGGFVGDALIWACSPLGAKDPSELFIEHGKEEAARMIRDALRGAEKADIAGTAIPEVIPGAPINLRQPEEWIYSDDGIFKIDQAKHTPKLVTRTPILLTKRVKSLDMGEERAEVAFKRDGKWTFAILPRSTVFQNRNIVMMADLGFMVSSESSKNVVAFLTALEGENLDVIPTVEATSTFGWQPGGRFLPGKADDIIIDVEQSQRGRAEAYCRNGTFERWLEHMAPHRDRVKFRFLMAASFAAPLLRIVKQRTFFVYVWGGSRTGKTAGLKAALSVWGDPDRLMVSFNATQVGLERTAAFYCDLPLGIDERQLAGNRQEDLERIVYMIASGAGKIRGTKSGGLQTTQQWRTIALATGEEPISTDSSQTGISTRILEIYGGPFDNEQDAGLMHQYAASDYGWAGPKFIQKLTELEESDVYDAYEAMLGYLRSISDGKNGAHLAGVATIALADAMVDSWLFGAGADGSESEDKPQMAFTELDITKASWDGARAMAREILTDQVQENAFDVNENAAQFVEDWVRSNRACFENEVKGVRYGWIDKNVVYIYPSVLNQALKKAGYSPRKTRRYMAECGLIETSLGMNNETVLSVLRRYDGAPARFVAFHLGLLAGEDYAVATAGNVPEEWTAERPKLSEIGNSNDEEEDELPF